MYVCVYACMYFVGVDIFGRRDVVDSFKLHPTRIMFVLLFFVFVLFLLLGILGGLMSILLDSFSLITVFSSIGILIFHCSVLRSFL